MQRAPIEHLRALASQDPVYLTEPRRCRAALADRCPEYGPEVAVLAAAHQWGVVDRLLAAQHASAIIPFEVRAGQVIADLRDHLGLSDAWALWAAAGFGEALGLEVNLLRVGAPVVLRFDAATTEAGCRLSWAVLGAGYRVEIDGGVGDVTGLDYVDVHPQGDEVRYTLTATSPRGRDARQVHVSVPGPRIDHFSASHSVVTPGQQVSLSWGVAHAVRVEVDGGEGGGHDVTGKVDMRLMVPPGGVTFVLRAYGRSGRTAEAIIRVEEARVERFEVVPTGSIDRPGFALAWNVPHASRVEISGIGDVTGQTTVPLPESHRPAAFTLRAFTRYGGVVQKALRLPAANILEFAVEPRRAFEGADVKLTWRVKDARRLFVEGVGEVTGKRGVVVTARRGRQQYSLTAVGDANVARRMVEVEVASASKPPSVTIVFPRFDGGSAVGEPLRLETVGPLGDLIGEVGHRWDLPPKLRPLNRVRRALQDAAKLAPIRIVRKKLS